MTQAVYVHPLMAAKEFGQWLEDRMSALGLSQAALSKAADINEGSLSRYRRGQVTPDPATIHKLAGPLHADPDEMLTLAGHKDDIGAGTGKTVIIRTDNPEIVQLVRDIEDYNEEQFETAMRMLRSLYPRRKK